MTDAPLSECVRPNCDRDALDPDHPAPLCQSHLENTEPENPVSQPETSGRGSVCQEPETEPRRYTSVPAPLDELGAVFIPVPPREKGPRQARTPENLMAADDPVLGAYLEAGHSYGITCRGDTAVLDADEPNALASVIDALPETAWQVSGSRESKHYFLHIPGLDEDIPLDDPETGENLGHIKAAEQSLVIGPGSRHPSGNRYGPLHGDTIATLPEDEFRDLIAPYRPDSTNQSEDDHDGPLDNVGARSSGGDAVDLDVHDILSSGSYPAGTRCEHPFHGSSTGANFMVDDDGDTWRCWRHNTTGNALHLIGIEEGIISCGDWNHGGLSTDTWRDIFTTARDAGYDLPDHNPTEDADHVAILPRTRRLENTVQGWDWQHAAHDDHRGLTIEDAQERTTQAIAKAYQSRDHVLIEALPTMGKSYGSIKAARKTGEPVAVLTGRGRKEQYEQFEKWCREHDLTVNRLPSFMEACTTANGDHGDEWAERVRDWYHRGATPKQIHAYAESVLGRPLPCQEHDGQECRYKSEWRAAYETPDGDPYDVLLGHYTHAYNQKVTEGRTVVFDEFPDAYETTLTSHLPSAISTWLENTPTAPYEDYTDLLEHRQDERRRADTLTYLLDDDGIEPDETHVIDTQNGHAAAPLAVFTILASDNLGNGFERTRIDDHGTGVRDRTTGKITILRPPDLQYARGVVALDGTPTMEMWELALDTYLDHEPVLTQGERATYIQKSLNLQLVRTTDAIKPYNSPDHVNPQQDAALLEAIHDQHGERPSLITTSTAEHEYETSQITHHYAESRHYGNVLGSNEYSTHRLGAVIGSNHYGDHFIKKWGAYANEAAERNQEKGQGLSYGDFGDRVLQHMREHDTLQAAMRYGRDGNGAVVYVHTNTLPQWVPTSGEGRVLKTWSPGMQQVLEATQDRQEWTTTEIAEVVDIGERQVRAHLTTLVDEYGVLHRHTEGNGYVWQADGLHAIGEHGDVSLDPIDPSTLTQEESAELARTTIYTWEFRTSGPATTDATDVAGDVATDGGRVDRTGGDRPPDDRD